jgi:AraC family transcriptional regulator
MAEASGREGDVRCVELVDQRAFRDCNVESICRLLLADTAAGAPVGPLYGEHLACSLTTYLAERFGRAKPRRHVVATSLPGPVLKRVCELIETRLSTPIGLEDLAREANMSRFYFSRLFRNSTGETPYRYLTKRRIERAKEMLARGCAEDQVASCSGFANRSHFGSLFRKYAGVTPRKFRSLFQ